VRIQNLAFMETSLVQDGVVLTVTHPLDAAPDPSAGSSSFPLSASDFQVNPGPADTSGLGFTIDGVHYLAALEVGSAASSADVTAMDEVIASIRPPSSTASPSTAIGSVQTIDLGWDSSESSTALASLQGFAWVSGYRHSSLIDQAGESTPLPFKQGPFSLSSSASATWATGYEPGSGDYVARFQPGSAVPDLMTVPIGDLGLPQVVATNTALWVFGDDRQTDDGSLGTLLRLDPNTGAVVKKVRLDTIAPTGLEHAIVYATSADDQAVWIVMAELRNEELGTISLVRLDASTYETTTYDPGRVAALVAGDGAVWLPGEHGPVRLDPVTGQTLPLDIPDEGAVPFAASKDAVWFLGGSSTTVELFRLDLINGEPAGVGLDLTVDRGRLWGFVTASFDDAGSVWLLYESGPLQEVQVGG
jgi:streptogramin lyase